MSDPNLPHIADPRSETLGRKWPNLLILGSSLGAASGAESPDRLFRIELDTALSAAQCDELRRNLGRPRMAANVVISARKDVPWGMRQFVQLGFDGSQQVWGIHPWDLGIERRVAADDVSTASVPRTTVPVAPVADPVRAEVIEDFGPSAPWRAAVRFVYDVPFDPVTHHPDEVRAMKSDQLKDFIDAVGSPTPGQQAIVKAFVDELPK